MMVAACFVTLLCGCGGEEKATIKAQSPTPSPTLAADSDGTPEPLTDSDADAFATPTRPPKSTQISARTPAQFPSEAPVEIPIQTPAGSSLETEEEPTPTLRPVDPATQQKIDALRKLSEERAAEALLTPTPY